MIKKYAYFFYLIFALLFGLLSYMLGKHFNSEAQDQIDVQKVEQAIARSDANLELLLSEYYTILKQNAPNLEKQDNSGFFEKFRLPKQSKFIFLIYRNDTLRYWSDNSFPAKQHFAEYDSTGIVHAENGWYRIKYKKHKTLGILGLYRIKNNFFYENNFLKNDFTLDANIPSSAVMSLSPISIGKDIKDKDGHYLFSLIPSYTIIEKKSEQELPFGAFVLFILSLLLFANKLIQSFSDFKGFYLISFIIWAIIGAFLYLLLHSGFVHDTLNSALFEQKMFALYFPFDNIANILVFTLFMVFTALHFFNIFPLEASLEKLHNKNKRLFQLLIALALFACGILFVEVIETFRNIMQHSKMSFEIRNLINPDFLAVLVFSCIVLIILSLIYVLASFVRLSERLISFPMMLPGFVGSLFFSLLYALLFVGEFSLFPTLVFHLIAGIIIVILMLKEELSYFSIIGLIAIFSVFFGLVIMQTNEKLEKQKQKNLIKQLAHDKDPMAERFLRTINRRLMDDTLLVKKIAQVSENQSLDIYDYLRRKYFYGFWEKYDLEISLCGNTAYYREENQANNCRGFYEEERKKFGKKIENTNFWLMRYNTGKIIYFSTIDIPPSTDPRLMSLYITLSEKLTSKSLGYPALLIDKSTKTKTEYNDYSYAKYSKGVLAAKFGDYPYKLNDRDFCKENQTNFSMNLNKYAHLVYTDKTGKKIVLSKKKETLFDRLISLTYLFVFFNVFMLIIILFYDYHYILKSTKFNFKNKIRFSMILILLISFVLFVSGTLYFTIRQNEKFTNREVNEKIQSVLIELFHKLQYETELSPSWHSKQYDHLDELLNKFSQIFFADINLYDLNGMLLASSRSEIFNRGLLSKQMHPKAYFELISKGKTAFIQSEFIGNMEFSSNYVPLRNEDNKTIAFINIPYFSDSNKVKKSISDVLIATLNLYLLVFIFTIFLSVIFAKQITRPLILLQNKIKSVQLGKKHTKIIYRKQDEIGALVKEYNLMVGKLEESAGRLAESERESAWREMAKQIAHEIKNPLTPMKLSIQLLQKTWYVDDFDKAAFEQRLNKVAQTLIEQINTLSSIASEFSAFAKMPKARKEEVEIVQKLKNVKSLFENEKNIDIILKLNAIEKLYVIADKEQISRVFINLVKNAVQAIPAERKGKIVLELKQKQNRALITIEDNGEGIPEELKERLFEPSFTTKTTGMGIGLAMVKNILNAAGGNIDFKSEKGVGTKFTVEFIITAT